MIKNMRYNHRILSHMIEKVKYAFCVKCASITDSCAAMKLWRAVESYGFCINRINVTVTY